MHTFKFQSDLQRECLAHMNANGLPFDGSLKCDGKIHRFSIDAKKNQPDEWYVCHDGFSAKNNPYLVCKYGTWSGGQEQYIYKSYDTNSSLSYEERLAIKAKVEEKQKRAEQELKADSERRILRAQEKWEQSVEQPTLSGHSTYLNRKQVNAYGIKYRVEESGIPAIVIPLCNIQGQVQAVQCIDEDGSKKTYGAKKGNFHVLGSIKDNSQIYVAEGYATAASIHEVTGFPTVFAVDCGNLQPVIANLRLQYPHNEIIIAADNDIETTGNPGKTKAEEATKAHRCKVVIPTFPEDFKLPNNKPATDFNDLHVHFGLDKVKEQLEPTAQLESTPQIQQSNGFQFQSVYSLIQEPPKANWLIKSYLDMGSLGVLFGEPGSMKSFLAIDMGYSIATGKEWHGHQIRKSGPVFYIAGEGFAGLSKRLRAWSLANSVDLEGIPFFISNRPTQFLDPNSTLEVIRSIDELKDKHDQPVFVVIDTLNRNFGLGDENNTQDMTAFIQSIDMAIRTRYGCSVLIVHHTPLNDTKRARGASALRGALDWEYCLSKHTGDTKKLFATKVKDYELPQEIYFKPKSVSLHGWVDQEDSEIMTSCVLEKIESPVNDKLSLPKLQGAQKIAYDCLLKLVESNPEGVLIDDWRKVAYEASISSTGTSDAKKKAFQRAINELSHKGYARAKNDLWNICGTRDRDGTFGGHVPIE